MYNSLDLCILYIQYFSCLQFPPVWIEWREASDTDTKADGKVMWYCLWKQKLLLHYACTICMCFPQRKKHLNDFDTQYGQKYEHLIIASAL